MPGKRKSDRPKVQSRDVAVIYFFGLELRKESQTIKERRRNFK